MVIVVISVILAIVFPRFTGTTSAVLKTEGSKVSSFLRFLNESSATRKMYYRVWFDIEKNSLRVESSRDGIEFKDETDDVLKGFRFHDAAIQDVVIPGLGKVNTGQAAILMTPAGSADTFTLHLKAAAYILTLTFNPYSGEAVMSEGYL